MSTLLVASPSQLFLAVYRRKASTCVEVGLRRKIPSSPRTDFEDSAPSILYAPGHYTNLPLLGAQLPVN
jgi:hypothetical protein